MRVIVRALAALLVVGVAVVAVYWPRPVPDPPIDFSDDLKGPASENFVIPFDAFALTPAGLLRSRAVTGPGFGNDRPVIKTRSGAYLSREFVFEIDVTIPVSTHDIAYVGFGLGANNPAYNNEPAGAFLFRIHNLPGVDTVHAAASRLPSTRPSESGPQVFARLETLGRYIPGQKTTFRIEHGENRLTLSIPDQQGASHTFALPAYPGLFEPDSSYLFFGNSAEGTVFSNVRVRPRG